MPPRKRTAAKPEETEGQQMTGGPEAEEPAAPSDASGGDSHQPAPGDAHDGAAENDAPTDDAPKAEDEPQEEPDGPTKSDLQSVDQPCTECMPNGWPEGAFSVGCTHGTWIRKHK
ncbi:hypothetical protein ACWDBF_21505 [Streptomyces angustmyceticus]